MASYLGKISAVVVANTANFSRNLNTAAGDLRKFAGTVQRDITKASTDANRAFGSMLTPLQRLERSLQAASSMKLSFRGFSGAIRTVDELQQRLTRLNQKQIDLVVKTSGFRTITQFRQAIEGIDQQTFDFALRFGGLDGLREIRNQVESLSRDTVGATLFAGRQPGVTNVLERLKTLRETVDSLSGQPRQLALQVGGETQLKRAELAAIGLSRRDLSLFLKVGGRENLDRVIEEIQSVDKTTIDALVKVRGVPELDAAIERFSAASPEQINAVIKVLGEQDLVSATERMRALASAGRQVFEPLASVANGLPSLGLRVEQAFLPGFSAVQSSADRLKEQIDGIGTGANTSRLTTDFDKAAAAAERAVQSFNRLKQASTAVATFDDGTSFRFVQPEATAAIERALRLQQQSLNLTPSQQRTGNFAFRSQQIAGELRSLEELNARRESIVTAGPGFGVRGVESYRQALAAADSAILQQAQKVSGLLDIWERVTNQVTAAERAQQASSQLNVLSPSDVRGDLETAAAQQIGAGTDITIRQFDQLAQRVQGVRSQIDSLPATVGSQFVPQLQRAEQEFIRLRASGRATAEEIENASNNVDQLAAQVRRVGAAQGLGSFADGLDDTALRGAIGNLQALQQILNRVGATAGSDAARQFDRMRAAIQQATRNGTIGSEAFQRELRQISQEAANAAAATGKIGRSAAFREIQRGGDIARGGFDKFSLAAQQAAFAIDDFFSATGDISQKIRAVQNNVTQLAFILGGTTGLFIGLGVAIAAQAAVALFKWSQGTVDAEDKSQALNDALARQKGLVEELKQAFDSLGDSLTRGIFDEETERAREFEQQLKSIEEAAAKQVEFAAAVSPEVQAERAKQADLQKQLEESSDGGQRAALQSQIDLSKQAESRAIERERQLALSVDFDQVSQALIDGVDRITRARAGDLFQPSDEARANVFRVGGVESSQIADGLSDARAELGDDLLAAERALLDRYNALTETFNELPDTSGLLGFGRATLGLLQGAEDNNNPRFERAAVEDERNKLARLREQVRFKTTDQNSKIISDALRAAKDAGGALRESLSIIQSDLGGSGPLAQQQAAIANKQATAISELTGAPGEDGRFGTPDDTLKRSEIEERQKLVVSLVQQAEANLSAVRSAKTFSEVLARVAGELSETVAGEAQSAASQARRELNKAIGEQQALPAGASPEQQLAARRAVQQALEGDAEAAAQAASIAARRRQIQADQRIAEQEFQRQAAGGQLGQGLQQSIRERDRLQALVASGQGGPEAASRLEQVIADIAAAFEQTDLAQRLRGNADALDQEQQRFVATRNRRQGEEEQLQQSIQRGQDLLKTPEQRAAEEGVRSFNDAINASVDGLAAQLNQFAPNIAALEDGRLTLSELSGVFAQFPALRDQFIQDLQVARENVAGNISAQIAQFDADRGRPSRAALQAQDVNTQQGRAELNRLLRGDDANRDQPVLQGIKEQTAVLKRIDSRIDEVGRAVGIAGT